MYKEPLPLAVTIPIAILMILAAVFLPSHHGELGDECSATWKCNEKLICAHVGFDVGFGKRHHPMYRCVAVQGTVPCNQPPVDGSTR